MKTRFSLLLTTLIALFLSSCLDSKKKNSSSTTHQDEFITVSVNNDYEISVLKDMQKTTGLNSDASLQYQNIYKEIYTIVIEEPKKEFEDALKELDYEEKSTIGFYRNIQLKRLGERMDISDQSIPSIMNIGGLEAETLEIDAKVDNIEEELTYFLTFIDGNSSIYMIMSWTLKSKRQEHKKTFKTIAESFKMID
jgi:hypothetical protein